MKLVHLSQNIVVLVYLAVTLTAFVLTMTHWRPLFSIPFVYYSYGMMAPYQGDIGWNTDFPVEGLREDGTWERIDVDAYLPVGFGERNVRRHLHVFGGPERQRRFVSFALQLLAHEREQGRPYGKLRISLEQWPRSPHGFEALRREAFLFREEIVTVE